MAGKITELPAAGALTGSELIETVQAGVNKKTTTQAIADLGGGGYLVRTVAQMTAPFIPGQGYQITDAYGGLAVINIVALDASNLEPFGSGTFQNTNMPFPIFCIMGYTLDDISYIYDPLKNNTIVCATQKSVIDNFQLWDIGSNNTIIECIITNVPVSPNTFTFNDNYFQNVAINFNTHHTGVVISSNKWAAMLGSGADILTLVGDNISIRENVIGSSALLTNIGGNTTFQQNILELSVDIFFNSKTGILFTGNNFKDLVVIDITDNDEIFEYNIVETTASVTISGVATDIHHNHIDVGATVTAPNNLVRNYIGINSSVDSTGGAISNLTIGNNVTFAPAGAAAGDTVLGAVQEFADNAAAVSGGLLVGTIYRTADDLKVVHA